MPQTLALAEFIDGSGVHAIVEAGTRIGQLDAEAAS
jgi:hypothetical protein